jgi:hypothetical protein
VSNQQDKPNGPDEPSLRRAFPAFPPRLGHIPILVITPWEEWPRLPFTARNFLTRPPTGTPRRAISPSEHILIVRVLRTRRAPGHSFSLLQACSFSLQGMHWGRCLILPFMLVREYARTVTRDRRDERDGRDAELVGPVYRTRNPDRLKRPDRRTKGNVVASQRCGFDNIF